MDGYTSSRFVGTIVGSFAAVAILALVFFVPVTAQPSGAAIYPVYNVTYITTNTTTVALTGAGVLHSFCVTDVGSSSNTATVYDNTAGSGTIIALFDIDNFTAGCAVMDARVTTGITVVTATGTAGEITLTYRGNL